MNIESINIKYMDEAVKLAVDEYLSEQQNIYASNVLKKEGYKRLWVEHGTKNLMHKDFRIDIFLNSLIH